MLKFWLLTVLLLTACAPVSIPQPVQVQPSTDQPPAEATLPAPPKSTEQSATNLPPAAIPSAVEAATGALWVQILSPQDGETVNTPSILIKGQAPAETVVTVNDEILVVSSNQTFEIEVKLEAGPNLIEILASDLNGNEVYIPLSIDYEP
jgi:hypothetical protein